MYKNVLRTRINLLHIYFSCSSLVSIKSLLCYDTLANSPWKLDPNSSQEALISLSGVFFFISLKFSLVDDDDADYVSDEITGLKDIQQCTVNQ